MKLYFPVTELGHHDSRFLRCKNGFTVQIRSRMAGFFYEFQVFSDILEHDFSGYPDSFGPWEFTLVSSNGQVSSSFRVSGILVGQIISGIGISNKSDSSKSNKTVANTRSILPI